MLTASRLLLGIGEGGGFPAATRAIAEWFPVKERSMAMGIINAGTAVGAVIAPPLIATVILDVHWLQLSSWRWVFFITGAVGLLWTLWWVMSYFPPEQHRGLTAGERAKIHSRLSRPARWWQRSHCANCCATARHGEIVVKFLSDAAWAFLFVLAAEISAGRAD
jgi:ACS family hexuronate transporter-like MFS transporter